MLKENNDISEQARKIQYEKANGLISWEAHVLRKLTSLPEKLLKIAKICQKLANVDKKVYISKYKSCQKDAKKAKDCKKQEILRTDVDPNV